MISWISCNKMDEIKEKYINNLNDLNHLDRIIEKEKINEIN